MPKVVDLSYYPYLLVVKRPIIIINNIKYKLKIVKLSSIYEFIIIILKKMLKIENLFIFIEKQ